MVVVEALPHEQTVLAEVARREARVIVEAAGGPHTSGHEDRAVVEASAAQWARWHHQIQQRAAERMQRPANM